MRKIKFSFNQEKVLVQMDIHKKDEKLRIRETYYIW